MDWQVRLIQSKCWGTTRQCVARVYASMCVCLSVDRTDSEPQQPQPGSHDTGEVAALSLARTHRALPSHLQPRGQKPYVERQKRGGG